MQKCVNFIHIISIVTRNTGCDQKQQLCWQDAAPRDDIWRLYAILPRLSANLSSILCLYCFLCCRIFVFFSLFHTKDVEHESFLCSCDPPLILRRILLTCWFCFLGAIFLFLSISPSVFVDYTWSVQIWGEPQQRQKGSLETSNAACHVVVNRATRQW